MADITITHTHADGTQLTGSTRGDGVYEIVTKTGFTWRRTSGIHIRPSRDRDAKTWVINRTAEALRAAGHEVTIEIDNTPRDTAVVEAERAERAENRAGRYAERSDKAAAAGDAREQASRSITDGIPFGQPVQPPGHHSRNAHLNALNRAENHQEKAFDEWKKAGYLADRAQGAIANQQHRENPRVTMRRIETLEADKRRLERSRDGYERNFRNGRNEVVDVEKHEPATGSYRESLDRKIAHLEEQITYWRTQLDQHAETGTFVPWGREHFVKGDLVRHHGFGDWYVVARINAKSVSVANVGWPRTITWDDVAGRRRDGMQWDTPNGQPWPVELARKVARWPDLERALGDRQYGDDVMRKRIRVQHAQRIVLGLDLQAADAEVATFLEAVADVDTDRHVKAAFVDVYDRLAGGEKTPDVRADYAPIELAAAWRMPDREPQRRIAAKTFFARNNDDVIAVRPGDLVVGWYDNGIAFAPSASSERIVKSFCGPVATVSAVNDRREAGEWVTITLVGGQEATVKTHRWLAVHPAGTWEQNNEPEAAEAPTVVPARSTVTAPGADNVTTWQAPAEATSGAALPDPAEQAPPPVPPIFSGIAHGFQPKPEGHEGGPSYCVAPCHRHESDAVHATVVVEAVVVDEPDVWGPVLDEIEALAR